jgi:hypothetical protein
MIRASSICIAVIALIAVRAAPAAAGRWGRPVTVSDDGVRDRLDDFPGFVTSPDGQQLALVTLREHKGIVVYPVARSGRLGRGSFLPASKDADYPWEEPQAEHADHGQYPDAAIDDKGIAAVAWQSLGPSGEVGEAFRCSCEIRVDVGSAGRHFSSIVVARSGRAVLGVQITPAGQVQVLWEADRGQLMLAEIDKPWRSASERTVLEGTRGQSGREAFLIDDAGHPQVLAEQEETHSRTVMLTQQPFQVATPIGLSWASEEGIGEPGWSLLSDGHGLAMTVIANVQRDELEVATPDGTGASIFRPVSALIFGPSARPDRCGLAGAMNARAQALVAWTCYPGENGSEVIRSALLDAAGDVIAISPADPGNFGNGSEAAVAFDDAGHGVVAREEWPYATIFLEGGHFSQWLALPHGLNQAQPTVAVGVTASGVSLASWVEEPSQAEEAHASWAGRIQLDRSEPEPSPSPSGEAP